MLGMAPQLIYVHLPAYAGCSPCIPKTFSSPFHFEVRENVAQDLRQHPLGALQVNMDLDNSNSSNNRLRMTSAREKISRGSRPIPFCMTSYTKGMRATVSS